MWFYSLIEPLAIQPGLFEGESVDTNVQKIIMEWRGNSDKQTDWSGFNYSRPRRKGFRIPYELIDANPIGFEPNDALDYEALKEYKRLKWNSTASANDTDGLEVTLKWLTSKKFIALSINDQKVRFSKEEIVASNNYLLFNEKDGLEGTLIIKDAPITDLPPELYALRDMVLAGKGEYKVSPQLCAMSDGFNIGYFKKGDNPLSNYPGDMVNFIKPIWGKMKGPGWDFEKTTKRVAGYPLLIDSWMKENFEWVHITTGPDDPGSPSYAYANPTGCTDGESLQRYWLIQGGLRRGGKRYPQFCIVERSMQSQTFIGTENGIE